MLSRTFLLLAALLLAAPGLTAATTVGYLQQITVKGPGGTFPHIPAAPAAPLQPGFCPQQTSQQLCNYGPFDLPGYGKSVYVGFSGQVPGVNWAHDKPAEIHTTSNGLYNWGSDTDFVSLYNTDPGGGSVTYTMNFYFDGLNAPNPSDLFLLVTGLKAGTTVTVSGTNASGPAKLSNLNAGEYAIPSDPSWWCSPTCKSTSPTIFPGNSGSLIFSSGAANSTTDSRNTGWDLYQPNASGLRVLTLQVTQQYGDGIGLTVGYRVCPKLIANSLDSRDQNGRIRHLYDLNPSTGLATNPRIIGPQWSLAFSPIAPNGTLYALAQDAGSLPGNALFGVDPATGASTELTLLTSPYNPLVRGGFAADPTTGLLFGTDGAGNLFTVGGGVVTPVGKVGGTYYHGFQLISSMAFDASGNLYLVDTGNNLLLKVTAPVSNATAAAASSVSLGFHKAIGFAALAIDPWTGKALYAEAGELYNLNLSTGSLTPQAPVTGAEDSGFLASMTYMVAACPAVTSGSSSTM